MAETIKIGGELESTATGNVVASTNHIKDRNKDKYQSDINAEIDTALADRYTKEETYNKEQLNNLITTPDQNYVSVSATSQTTSIADVLPASGASNTIYRIGSWDGSQYRPTVYSEYTWDGNAYIKLNTKEYGIDDEPTAGSDNLVKSGGIHGKLAGFASFETISGNTVQLKDGQGNNLMPKTDAECVEELVIDDYDDENEFAIQDGKGHAIAFFSGGHLKTKKFNSKDLEDAYKTIEEDFAIQDEANKAIMMVINGYPVTKNFNGKEIASAAVDSTKTGLYAANDFRGYTIITVGVGRDYATIQEAINSVTNASVNNQYIVLVYDDYYVDDITELWKMSDRTKKISSIADIDGGQTCAYIWTKDYVHIMGVGQRTIHVNLPTDVINSSNRRQYVHNVYHRGSAMLANLKIISQNCRYCIHSEGGSASETSEDFCAVKKFVNLECVYIGHEGGNYQMAWGVGLANGLNITAIGCRFIGKNGAQSGYSHTHPGYKFPATVNIVNCIFDEEGVDGNFDYGELFSGQNSRINIEGSSIHHFNVSYNISLAVNENTDFDVRHNRIQIHGNNNNIRLGAEYVPVLHIDAKNNGDSITSVSGTAFDALFIDWLEKTPGTPSKPGMWTGCRCIWYSSTNANKSNFASLGYNLGDCSSVNKTLFITVGNHTESVLFDKNYGGLSGTTPIANYSNDEILSEINAQLTYCEIKAVRNMGRLCFDDELMLVYNPSTEAIPMNKLVTIDTSSSIRNAVRLTSAEDVVVGVTRYPIQPQAYGYIIKRGKGLLWQTTGVSYGLSNIKGQLYKAGDNGKIVIAQSKADAYLYGIDASTLVWI